MQRRGSGGPKGARISKRMMDDITQAVLARDDGGSAGEDAMDALVRADRRLAVQGALARMDDGDRELLRLAFDEELDAAEIGRRLGASPGTVRVRKHRALRRLAELLGGGNAGGVGGT